MAGACTPPSGSCEGLTLNFMKWQWCILIEGQEVMLTVARTVFTFLKSTNSGTVTLKDYLLRKEWKTAEMEQFCTKEWEHILTTDLMNTEFDITFACKLLTRAFSEVYERLSEDCQNSIKELRYIRNKLSHCFAKMRLKKLDVNSEVSKLRQLFTGIYNGVGDAIKIDFSDSVENTKKNLDQICKASFKETYDEYMDKVKNLKDNLPHILISKGQEELREYYKNLRIVNPCTWMLEKDFARSTVSKFYIEKIYTPLKIEDSRDYEIDAKIILKAEKEKGDSSVVPDALMLYGLAGCGKTSLCRYILHSWSECPEDDKKIEGVDEFDLVFLVEARSLQGRKVKEFLEKTLPRTYRHILDAKIDARIGDSIGDDVINALADLQVLFIIDGFDENRKDATVFVEDILKGHRIIVTTRPEFLSRVDSCLKNRSLEYLTVKICGFDDKRRNEFTKKVFAVAKKEKDTEDQCKHFLKYIEGRGRILGDQLKLPLTLALLIYLWIEKVKDHQNSEEVLSNVTNCTTLYCQLFKLCMKKLIERLNKDKDKCNEKYITDTVIKDLLLFIGKKAWECLKTDQVDIPAKIRKEIEDECGKLGVDKDEMMSAFLMCEYSLNKDCKDETSYSFLHKTQMEYLAAQFLAHENLPKITEENDWEGFQQVIIFLMGHTTLLGKTSHEDLRCIFDLANKAEIRDGRYDFWWKFLLEAKKQKKVGEFIAKYYLPRESWSLTENDKVQMIVPGLELLMSIPAKIETLKIEVDNRVDPYDIENLLEVMKELQSNFRYSKRYGKNNPIKTELHFWRHNEYRCKKPSDDFVRTLRPWGHLTNLTGCLGIQEEEKELLSYCFKLKTLRVRLCSVRAVMCLSASLEKIYKSIRSVRVTLDILSADKPNPSLLSSLTTNGDLEVTIPGVRDADKEWVVAVVRKISSRGGKYRGQGCRRLVLDKSELTCCAVKYLTVELTRVVTEKLSVQTNCNITEEEVEAVAALKNETHINVDWI